MKHKKYITEILLDFKDNKITINKALQAIQNIIGDEIEYIKDIAPKQKYCIDYAITNNNTSNTTDTLNTEEVEEQVDTNDLERGIK